MNDPKPAKRIVNRDVQPLDRTPLETGVCPVCGGPMLVFSRAHIVPKGQRGDDVPENVAWICGDGTRGCHGVLTHRGRGDHGLDYGQVSVEFVRYVRDVVPMLGAFADSKVYVGWVEDYYLGTALEAEVAA